MGFHALPQVDLAALAERLRGEHRAFRARGLSLDMTRGKPSAEQLDLANPMLAILGNGDVSTAAGEDARNYGGLQGLPEARTLLSALADAPADAIAIGENSSLALMHDCIVWALLRGVPGSPRPWSREEAPAFICPAPGYDRHFGLCEEYGIRMLPVRLTGEGPDMDEVERLAADATVKGMWCVPKYSNPTGDVYSPETVRRLAGMRTGAPDFRLFWDNAYAVHHLTDEQPFLENILDACAAAGNPDRPFVFASTSKVTLAGAGLALFASSPENLRWYLARAGRRSIGPDKIDQLRHVRFLRDAEGLARHMEGHRAILAPKFAAVDAALQERLGPWGVARWTRPKGGYFVSVDARPGTAKRVVALAREIGIALTPAGSTWPHWADPEDANLRLAPSFPPLAEVSVASQGIALCILLAAVEVQVEAQG